MWKHVFFDLDGTLLPMVQDEFVEMYMPLLAKRFVKWGIEPQDLIRHVWKGVGAMVKNDGAMTNEEAFWNCFAELSGVARDDVEGETLDFYANEFNQAVTSTQPTEMADQVVKLAKEKGAKVYLATNPIFPRVATMNRIQWAGLDPEDFEIITTYEDCHYSKPNVKYFQEIIDQFGISAEECLMVGNDALEDTAIRALGVKTYIVTDCLENKKNLELETDYQGSMEELYHFIKDKL